MTRATVLLTMLMLCLAGCFEPAPDSDPDAAVDPDPQVLLTSEACDACAGDCLIESFQINAYLHVQGGVVYDDRPPTGGDHDPCWAPYGVHDTEVAAENWVHNMEHGAIVLLYNCPTGCLDEVALLSSVAASVAANTLLVSSYPDMQARFAVVSWGWRMLLGCADDASVFTDFYTEHFANAPETTTVSPSPDCMQ